MKQPRKKAGHGKTRTGDSKNIGTLSYREALSGTSEIAAHVIAARHRLDLTLAREVCRLAGIGGEA